ncbi:MAG TPA: DNA mismatch repair protein MutS [Acidobacteriota bacterium]|nr:DNA mismatch repair protein MutS [Acidobacteriota bacterium]
MEHLTPMMRQYHEVKQQHPDKLVFFRMGDFYEMFYDDAVLASRELEITLTSRNNDKKGKPIPMAGVPHHAKDSYLGKLVKRGHKVVLCEQVEDPKQAKGLVRREVTQVVTPGTAVEEGLLDSKENNFLASLYLEDGGEGYGAAFLDVSTGEFWVSEFEGRQALQEAVTQVMHFQPRELVMAEGQEETLLASLPSEATARLVRTRRADWHFNLDYAQRQLLTHFKVSTLDGFGVSGCQMAIQAAGALIHYIRETRKSSMGHISGMRYFESSRYLKLDEATTENLELIKGADGGRRWTLLSVIDRTQTGMGARLVRSWMLRPSLDLKEINARLDAVQELRSGVEALTRLTDLLKDIYDVERLLSRVTTETAHPRDLLSLKTSLAKLPELSRRLEPFEAALLAPFQDHLEDVVDLLEGAVDEQASTSISDGKIIRKGYNEELDELRKIASSGKGFIAKLEAKERERTGISNLKVKYNKVFGYFIEVTKANLDNVPEHYIRKQTLVNSERFITPELKEYEEKVLGAEEKILALEKELFLEVRSQVAEEAQRIQAAARAIARIDVLAGLADAANKYGYSRPLLDESTQLHVEAGRHPVLELQGNDPFVPNDLNCDTDENQLLILTGPNMGGKSTYLRQNALIVILAQMGSFVPAEKAQVGLVDRIYTRVGASDNLARGRSTFMVEMIETANILNTATPRSLILLDEVGRGTATFDGLSIAWSVAEFLTTEGARRARTLFATHYHECTKLEKLYPGVKNYCVTVKESGGDIIFFHRVMEGVANKSYGIEVARLAGLPQPVLERAREILTKLERKNMDLSGRPSKDHTEEVMDTLQQTLF